MDKTVINLNTGWKFHLGECKDAWYRGYDDKSFRTVHIPHDWAVEQPFSKGYSSGTGYLAGGIGWYRLHFYLPEKYRGKQIRIVFDGVYKNSRVWVNSYHMGKHPNGYTGFSYDITELVQFGAVENVVSVQVVHTDLADSRWYTGSGITRKVTLVVEEKVHAAEDGICLITKSLEKRADGTRAAEICIRQEIVNDSRQMQEVAIETELCSKEGKMRLLLTKKVQLAAGERIICLLDGVVEHPELWSVEQPYLYWMRTFYRLVKHEEHKPTENKPTEICDERECASQSWRYLADEQEIGIRTAEFDAEKGFFLNGVSMKLKGVCLHHDAGCLGAAVTREIWQRRLEILKECGCNAVRCSHNPHMPELYALCDKMGFLVMDEAFDEWENAKNKWSTGHNVYPPKHDGYAEDFPEWHERDLKAMVRRDRRHPSVILWSIGNEIDYPNDPYCHPSFLTMTGNNDAEKPAAEREYDPHKPNAERMVLIAKKLAAIVKQEDTQRAVTMALAFPELSAEIGVLGILDVAGYNYKEHLYRKDHSRFPEKPFLGSENGHSFEAWQAVAEQEFISGQFLWTGIDYLGEAHGWPVHGSGAGLLDCAGFKKPRFFRRKSFWSSDPVLALATRSWDGRQEEWIPLEESWNYEPGEKVIVMCHSNLSKVIVRCNGEKVGCLSGYNADGAYRFEFAFEPGTLMAEGYDTQGKLVKTTELSTAGEAKYIKVSLYQDKMTEGTEGDNHINGKADKVLAGETQIGYLYQFCVQLTDENGTPAAGSNRKIRVCVEGAGELAGMENGDLADVTPYCIPERETREGRMMVYVRRTGVGSLRVVFAAEGIGGDGVAVEVD